MRAARLAAVLAAVTAGAGAPASASGAGRVELAISESHHHVLAHWLRAAREGLLPSSGVTVVHVDAHPDLAVPTRPIPVGSRDPRLLVSRVDIASFVLAAARVGLVDRVIWLRPDFAFQLPDGARTLHLGVLDSGLLRVDDPSDFYVLDEGWAPRSALADAVRVELEVLPLARAGGRGTLAAGAVILDVDLDTFSTRNPAADHLRRAGLADPDLDALRSIFARDRLVFSADPPTRIEELGELLAAVATLAEGPWSEQPGAVLRLWRRGVGPLDLLVLQRVLGRLPEGYGTRSLLENGRLLVGLPEHTRVAPDEVRDRARALADLLRSGAVSPSLVTLSRSVHDGFTPPGEWPAIEWAVLRELLDVLGNVPVRFDPGLAPAPPPR